MLILGVFDSFFVNLKVAAIFGLVVSSPIWLWQIWGFVAPGLYRNEKRYSVPVHGAWPSRCSSRARGSASS